MRKKLLLQKKHEKVRLKCEDAGGKTFIISLWRWQTKIERSHTIINGRLSKNFIVNPNCFFIFVVVFFV